MSDQVLVHSRITRVFHWLFAVGVTLLIFSGLYIHYPADLGRFYNMGTNVAIQKVAGVFTSGIFFSWVYYQILTQAYKDIVFKVRDIVDFKGLLKYYLFMEKKPPGYGKYNAGQKMIFTSWFIVFIFMFITGLVLYYADLGYFHQAPVEYQKVRFYHFLGALWFMATVPVHIYLVLTEDPAKLQAMFTGWLKK
jgi:Ni/Fe-hydrogenase 1 B-type cytochrome subunit